LPQGQHRTQSLGVRSRGDTRKDRSKSLHTNKCVLDQYLKYNLSGDSINCSAIVGLQFAGLHGQLFGIELLAEGLYFGFEGPTFQLPAQMSDMSALRQALQVLYCFKDVVIRKARSLPPVEDFSPIKKILHAPGWDAPPPKHSKANFLASTSRHEINRW